MSSHPLFKKRSDLTLEDIAVVREWLRKRREQGAAKRKLMKPEVAENTRGRKPLFYKYPPYFQEKAMENLKRLVNKHRAKVESKGSWYYAILVGTAVHVTKRQLGLLEDYKKVASRAGKRNYANLRAMSRIGLRGNRPTPDDTPNQVGYTNMEGI